LFESSYVIIHSPCCEKMTLANDPIQMESNLVTLKLGKVHPNVWTKLIQSFIR
jgi:hypothetical protein